MRWFWTCTYFFLLGTTPLFSQGGIRGYIKDIHGQPLAFATVYVENRKSGTATNEEGYYFLVLSPGTYQVRYQYLGYTTQTKEIRVNQDQVTLNVVLNEEPIVLQTIQVSENREDPAYTIMRRAIGKASYHAQQLDEYWVTSYIKGSGRLKKVPGLFKKQLEKAMKEEGMDTTTAFVTESVNEIHYKRPDEWEERVLSVRTVGEDNNTSPNSFINSSFYLPKVNGAISPLSPQAFTHYRFEYLGFFNDHGQTINKIRVVPRSPGDQVFDGIIYIVDQLWNIHSLDLFTYFWGIKFNINQVYTPVEDLVWMPLNQIFDVNGALLGFGFEYRYFANMKNYRLKINPDLPEPDLIVIDEKIDKDKAKQADAVVKQNKLKAPTEWLGDGQEISRKQLRKMVKEYEKVELEASRMDTLDEVTSIRNTVIDSNAYKQDSAYWDTVRPVPLTIYELKGYQRMDSISRAEAEVKSTKDPDTLSINLGSNTSVEHKKSSGKGFSWSDLAEGGRYRAGKSWIYGFNSPLSNLHFNTVEGLHASLPFYLRRVKKSFSFNPAVQYAFARQRLNAWGELSWQRKKAGTWTLEGGRRTRQYFESGSIHPVINDLFTLLTERNHLKLFEKTYLRAGWEKKFNDRWSMSVHLEKAQHQGLENYSDYNLVDRRNLVYSSNFPANEEIEQTRFTDYQLTFLDWHVETKPWLKYQIRNHKKEIRDHSSPTIGLHLRLAIPVLKNDDTRFQHVDAFIKHTWNVGAGGLFSAQLNAGFFANKQNVFLPMFKHFPGNQTFLTNMDPVSSYRILDYYRFSTSRHYLSWFTNYQFRKLLITRFPMVRLTGMRENLFFNGLETPDSKHYLEVGYGLNYIFRLFRVEVTTAFLDGRHYDWGIRIGIASSLDNLFNF